MLKQVLHHDVLAIREPRQQFPTLVTSVAKLSAPLQEAIRPHCSDTSHIVRIPSGYNTSRRMWGGVRLPFRWRQTPERILIFDPDTIRIIESHPAGRVTTTAVPRTALLKIHVYVLLLYSYLELVWVDSDHLETGTFEYNTVGEALILQGIDRLRAAYPPCLPPPVVEERAEVLARLPLKFRNYLRDSLLPGEQLYAAVFQPAIRQASGFVRPYLSPDRAVGITERQLILVENRRDRFFSEANYSTYCCFYPLAHIQHMTLEVTDKVTWLKLQHGCGSVTQATDIALSSPHAEALWAVLQGHVKG
ncbi:MAG: hypothetical protein K8L91_33740 [Anaerolineae bacterium]|nr:hypothetical protein [Anaerolineae bacterium]